jgi:hypothetical protein
LGRLGTRATGEPAGRGGTERILRFLARGLESAADKPAVAGLGGLEVWASKAEGEAIVEKRASERGASGLLVTGGGFVHECPMGTGAAARGPHAGETEAAVDEVFFPDEEESRHLAGLARSEMGKISSPFVRDKGQHTFWTPTGKLIGKLTASRDPHEGERQGSDFRAANFLGKP